MRALLSPEGGLLVGFCGALLIIAITLLVIGSGPWHRWRHLDGKGLRVWTCDRCSDLWLGGH